MNESLADLIAGGAILVGIVGTLVPILPGLLLVWAATFLWAWNNGFDFWTIGALTVTTALFAFGMYLGIRIPQRTASDEGLSMSGLLIGLMLALVLGFTIPVVGAPIGFIGGVFLVRFSQTRHIGPAWRSAVATVVALVKASAAQFGIAVAMGAVWLALTTYG